LGSGVKLQALREKVPRIYSEDELSKLLATGGEYSGLVFETLAKTGFRYQELAHAGWTDLSFADKAIHVTAKPHWGFRPKDSEERAVPLDDDLLGRLRALTEIATGDSPDLWYQRRSTPSTLVAAAEKRSQKAKLNCTHCSGCVERDEWEQYYLHRFR
jgi:integrase